MKDYGDAVRGHTARRRGAGDSRARVRDVSEFLDEIGIVTHADAVRRR